jgi:hypothetical protein
MPHGSPSASGSRSAAFFVGLLALLSLVSGSVALQAHHHPPHRPATYHATTAAVASAVTDEACALCAAAAAVEPYLPAAAGALVPPLLTAFAANLILCVSAARASRGHIWRSRAPPGIVSPS